jgi:hypothetical protein
MVKRIRRDVLLPRLFGMIWFLVGVPMLVVFLVLGDPTTDTRIRHNHETATGTVTAVKRAGDRNPHRVDFTFAAADGVEYEGRSYSHSRRGLAVGSEVAVEYLAGNPARSRIKGHHYSPIPPTMFLLPAFFIVAGGAIWVSGVVRLRRLRRLYEHGVVTTGTVLGAKWNKLIRVKTPRRILYELRYRFTDDRGRERTSASRMYAVPDSFTFAEGDTIAVLFDRADPAHSLALDLLQSEFTTDPH